MRELPHHARLFRRLPELSVVKVDLYTDAGVGSTKATRGLATWALVAIEVGATEPLFETSGVLRDKTRCSGTAELRAIANALHKLHRLGHVERGSEVRIYTDSHGAVERIEGRSTKRPQSPMAKATLVIHKLAEVHGIELRATWIKGHRNANADEHAKWNNRCDWLCRKERRIKVDDRPSTPADAVPVAKVKTKARTALDIAKRLSGAAS